MPECSNQASDIFTKNNDKHNNSLLSGRTSRSPKTQAVFQSKLLLISYCS
ncbi:hypothetical protein BACPEC_02644 [[Bacteroides] pectinophilus ATCC 43243]|uniref:Uncharacterized protein n=1 Tax=[Bacteroides] pectinophilus ATCC 43243 TaxID=483218 RepID=B7AV96_9FIRM|nr:hypothetical protein BACPEC_02644 [[Bacteroides] pectinophilus ATCC 43243]